jgi:polyphosphate glucokinase
VGKKKWNRRVKEAIESLRVLTHFDHLTSAVATQRPVKFDLPKNVSLVSNELGMRGGIWLWRERGSG